MQNSKNLLRAYMELACEVMEVINKKGTKAQGEKISKKLGEFGFLLQSSKKSAPKAAGFVPEWLRRENVQLTPDTRNDGTI